MAPTLLRSRMLTRSSRRARLRLIFSVCNLFWLRSLGVRLSDGAFYEVFKAGTSFHDRAVRAFGLDLQPLLQSLTVGVVGAGGTGSSVTEQLIRLGVGHLVVADGQTLERSNVSRVYGSETDDIGISKAVLMGRLARHLGFNTRIDLIKRPITYQFELKKLRDCDIIFGCTDDQWGRSLLSLFSIEYCIPVFDLGVKIDSKDGVIRSIPGRITTLILRRMGIRKFRFLPLIP